MKMREINSKFNINNLEIERTICRKMHNILNEYGRTYYRIIEHEHITKYKELDIISKKLIINKISNCIICNPNGKLKLHTHKERKFIFVDIMYNSKNTDISLQNYDIKVNLATQAVTDAKQNIILKGDTQWIKLYTDKEKTKEIDLSTINKENIRRYFKDELIAFCIKHKLDLPNIKICEEAYVQFNEIYKKFNKQELKYLGIET